MAQFFQDPNPSNDPNYIGSSKEPDRVQADTSMGKLFEGVGEFTNTAGKGLKNIFEESIKNNARELIEPIRAEHGATLPLEDVKAIAGTGAKGRVRAMQMRNGVPAYDDGSGEGQALNFGPEDAQTQQAIGLFDSVTKNDPSKALPPSAEKEIHTLSRMDQAYRAGNLSDSYYYGQLEGVVSKLRTRYPGWQDEIDQAVSQITGVTPANAIRRSLIADIQANQAAALAGSTADDKWRDQNAHYASALGYDPYKTDISILKPEVATYRGKQDLLKGRQLVASVGSPEAEDALSATMAGIVQTRIAASGNAIQGSNTQAEFQKKAQDAALNGLSKTDQDQWVSALQLEMQNVAAEMDRVAYKPNPDDNGRTLVSKVPGGDAKYLTIKQAQLQQLGDRIALVKSGAYSALERSTASIKEQDNLDVQNFRRAFPKARIATAISNSFPNNPYMQNQFLTGSDIVPSWQKALKNDIGNAILGGDANTPAPKPSQAIGAYGPQVNNPTTPAEKAQQTTAYNETRKQYDLVISPENKDFKNSLHVAKQFFGDRAFYENLNESGRLKLFMQFASPEKTAYVMQLARKDASVLKDYKEWAFYAAGDIWRRNADNLQSLLETKAFDVKYNESGGYFYDNTKYPGGGSYHSQGTSPNSVSEPINAVNNVLAMLKPITGNKPEAILPALGINPKAEKLDFWTTRLKKAVGDKIEDWQTEAERQQIKEGRVKTN